MIPKDVWLCFEGWSDYHNPEDQGSGAMTAEEYHELVRAVDVG